MASLVLFGKKCSALQDSTLRGVVIFYPEQLFNQVPAPYP